MDLRIVMEEHETTGMCADLSSRSDEGLSSRSDGGLAERSSPRLLVVDGKRDSRTLLELALSHSGYHVYTAPSCHSARLQLRVIRPDLIIVDAQAHDEPDSDEICRVREHTRAPVILLTTPTPGNPASTPGPDCTLTKPFRMAELRANIAKLIAGQ